MVAGLDSNEITLLPGMQGTSPILKRSADKSSLNSGRKPISFFKPVIQPKLSINQPNDVYEQEADAMADKVMRMTVNENSQQPFFKPAVATIHRKCADCEEEEKKFQRKGLNNNTPGISTQTENYINSLSGGQQLNKGEKSFFEPRFDYDFSNVKIHTGTAAARSASSINALAYTSGNNIVFNDGQYAPGTDSGKRLLAHELTHVVQQSNQSSHTEISRYSHDSSCREDDLRAVVWPGDAAARRMTNNAIRILTLAPTSPQLTPLYSKYFMRPTPNVSQIRSMFYAVRAALEESDYQYECVNEGCTYNGEVTTLPIIGGIGDIRLCVGVLSGKSDTCIGRTIIHEFTHYLRNTDDNAYCKTGCGYSSCPSSLTPDQALDNADSFACFAYELYSLNISTPSPASAPPASSVDGGTGPVDAGLPGGVE